MLNKNTNIGFDLNWDKLPQESLVRELNYQLFCKLNGSQSDDLVIINGLPIKFDPNNKVIGLNFSGGADSTLLFFLLCSIIDERKADVKIIASTMIRFWEDRSWTDDLATNIIQYLRQRFPNVEIVHEIGFIPPAFEVTPLKNINIGDHIFREDVVENAFADVYVVRSYSDYLANKHGIKVTYSGTTMNPEHLTDDVKAPTFRKKRKIQPDDLISYVANIPVHDPFRLIDKSWVMAQYENFGLNDLLLMTRSCGSDGTTLDKMYGKGMWTALGSAYSCGFCFFCLERQWAHDNRGIYLKGYHDE